MQDRI